MLRIEGQLTSELAQSLEDSVSIAPDSCRALLSTPPLRREEPLEVLIKGASPFTGSIVARSLSSLLLAILLLVLTGDLARTGRREEDGASLEKPGDLTED